jgi:cystathionine beta-lyase/cystathionine gamma-synthase
VLGAVLGGPAVTYSSGLAAFHALLVRLNPRRIFIGPGGYHGCAGVAQLVQRLSGMEILPLAAALEDGGDGDSAPPRPAKGDLVHIESPINPYGEAFDIAAYVARAKPASAPPESHAWVSVDATFAPPPLQNPLALGVDVVMHSGTKYFGGHSDLLCGVLAVNAAAHPDLAPELVEERLHLGSVMGNLEGWLGLRSLRTLELRVERQSRSAQALVDWLAASLEDPAHVVARAVETVRHASRQLPEAADPDSWLRRQMPRGFGPVFSIVLREERFARRLPSKLALFHHATSLGGVESLVEWRALTDKQIDRRLVRVSVGVEGAEDLRADLERAFRELLAEGSSL